MHSFVVVVVHPSRIFREGLTSTLAKSPFEPACTAANIDNVPATIGRPGEQVLVLMGVRDGDNLGEPLSAAKARFPDGHVVIVGNSRRLEHVATAIASEATSFVDENVVAPTLIKHLDLIAQAEPIISVLLLKRVLGNGTAPPLVETVPTPEIDKSQSPDTDEKAGPNPHLSPREAAILKALTQGMSNKVIAYQLQITEATVKVHVKAILRKIQVKNRTQAATWAWRQPASAARLGNNGGGSLSAVTLVAVPSP